LVIDYIIINKELYKFNEETKSSDNPNKEKKKENNPKQKNISKKQEKITSSKPIQVFTTKLSNKYYKKNKIIKK